MSSPTPLRSKENVKGFQQALISWFQKHAEDFPWRRTTDPYEVLVSEVMLQQTTVQAVIENQRFTKFLEEFPDIYALAEASEEEILRAWEGLGYYNRVRNLQKTALTVRDAYEGRFPETLEELLSLPGVGPYTAGAVTSFSFNLPAPLVDANVARLFSRLFNDSTPINSTKGQQGLWRKAETLLSQENPRDYNAALMELGQKVCKNRQPLCAECPVSQYCIAEDPASLPVKTPKQQAIQVTEQALWCRRKNGDLFLEKGAESRRKGLWRLPLVSPEETLGLPLLHTTKYGITKYKVTLKIYEGEPEKDHKGEWVPLTEIDAYPMPSPIRRVVEKLLSEN